MTPSDLTSTELITEDLLLVLFDAKHGMFRGEGSPLFHVLAGAVLTDLAIEGKVEIDEKTSLRGRQVHAVAGQPPADPILRATWERIAKKPTDVHSLILEIGPDLRATMIDRLVERGHIVSESRKVLGFIPSTTYTDGGTPRRDELVASARAVLVDGAVPDVRSGSLVGLLSASDALPMLDSEIPWSGDVYTRGKAIQQGDWGSAAAAEVVARTMAALLANNLFISLTLPTIRGE